jgi:hypothetical protein
MRHRDRIQPYISPEVHRKLTAYSVTEEVTESAVVEAALQQYLDRDRVQEPLILRRLDGLAHAVARVEEDLQILSWAFGRFVKYSYLAGPPAISPETIARMEGLYGHFLVRVGGDLGSGVTFSGAVRRALASKAARPSPANPGKDGREGNQGK